MLTAALRSCTRQTSSSVRSAIRWISLGHNDEILEMLKKERETYSQGPDPDGYKTRAFSNAIKVIERLDKPLASGEEAMKLKGIGFGIADRITAFIDSKQSPAQFNTRQRKSAIIRKELLQLPGIGIKKSQELIEAGCKSLEDLRSRKFFPLLSPKQQICIQYMDHLKQPVTSAEAETVAKFMRDNLRSEYEVILVGDYRRGLKSFPQIEIVLFHPNHVRVPIPAPPTSFNLPRVTRRLSSSPAIKQKYFSVAKTITHSLHGDAIPTLMNRGLIYETTRAAERAWDGIVRIPELVESEDEKPTAWKVKRERKMIILDLKGTFRRMRIVLAPQKSRAATMLAMTGDPEFVKYLRYKALSLEMHLDEFGLWRWHSRSDGADQTSVEQTNESDDQEPVEDGYWELVQVTTEEDMFSVLGMEYVPPARRNFKFLKVNTKGP